MSKMEESRSDMDIQQSGEVSSAQEAEEEQAQYNAFFISQNLN